MRRFNYPQSFSTGVIAAGGTLGAMLPPSTVLAVCAILTQQDIGKLFMAGIIPGLLAMAMYVLTIMVIVRVRPCWLPAGELKPWSERVADLKNVWAPVVLFIFVIGGLYGGFFTPTEAGGAGASGAFILGLLNVFVIKSVVKDVSFTTIFKGVLPFVATDIVRLVILISLPIIALWLPGRMG